MAQRSPWLRSGGEISARALDAHAVGVLASVAACLSWGIDNNSTQQLSSHDPIAIVQIKATAAGVGNVLLATMLGRNAIGAGALAPALAVGLICYGISIVLDVYALRFLGAAREAAMFVTAPFIGANASVPFLNDRFERHQLAATAAMAAGMLLSRWSAARQPPVDHT